MPGAEAEVDFGEVVIQLRGVPVKCMLFCLRLSYSGKAVHRVFASGGQEAFFEGDEHAFRVLGDRLTFGGTLIETGTESYRLTHNPN